MLVPVITAYGYEDRYCPSLDPLKTGEIPVLHIFKLRKGGKYKGNICWWSFQPNHPERTRLDQSPPSPQIVKPYAADPELLTTTPNMGSSNDEAFLVIILLETITGLFFSFSIIVCLSVKVFKLKNMMTYTKILIPFKVSNICYTIIFSFNLITALLWQELYNNSYVYHIIMYVFLYSITSSLWLAAVLCVFYFMKIIISRPGVLTTLKSRIGAVVWWLIITAEVVSLGGSFLSITFSNPQINQRNSSLTISEPTDDQDTKFQKIILMLNWLPFLVIMMTTFGSAFFLKLYNHQIEKNMAGLGNTRVRDYRMAIQTMIGLLVLYVGVFVCIIGLTQTVFVYGSVVYWMCVIFLFSFPTVLSALLINGNLKLKEAFKQMFSFGL